uniref:Uncharacterized protein n=1 Tax=Panagrolaimus sp. ES5 TaxID=591445 RepID=A0AC34GD21_9BILA
MQHIQEKFKLRGLKLPNENPKYEILSTTDVIENEINKVAQQSMEIFEGVSLEECQKLLHEFNWDGNRLLEKRN